MRYRTPLLSLLFVTLSLSTGRADVALFEKFDYPGGPLTDRGEPEMNGWSEPWGNSDLAVRDGAAVGQGSASRPMIPRVDFELDNEWFFRLTIQRTGVKQGGSDYAALKMYRRDSDVDNSPMFMGINSAEKFYAGAGVPQKDAILFGEPKADQAYTLVARLKTQFEGKDELDVWVFPADRPLPATPPQKPDVVHYFDYSGFSQEVQLVTGNADGYRARFDDLLITDSWQDLRNTDPEPIEFIHDYRRLRPVQVADNGTHMLPHLWGNMSVIRWDAGDRWQLYHNSPLPWLPRAGTLYTPVDEARRAQATPAPDPDMPLYDGGRSFEDLPDGNFQAVRRPDSDRYDLIRYNDMTYLVIRETDDGRREVADRYDLLDQPLRGNNASQFVGDLDGDGTLDLLHTRLREHKWNYWPNNESPWQRSRHELMGPDRDAAVNQNIRGYDVDGNWLGSPLTYELMWARGTRENGRLKFGDLKSVYQGRDDFPLLWRNPSQRFAAGLIERGGQRYIVMFSDLNRVLAAPIVDTGDGELHTGKAVDLLAEDTPRFMLNMDSIRGIVDLNGDGLNEIIISSGSSGHVTAIAGETIGAFRPHVLEMVGGPLAGATLITQAYGDWDGDGHKDIVFGDSMGLFTFFPGTDDPLVYGGSSMLRDQEGEVIRFHGTRNIQGSQEAAWGYTQAELFDWDRDGQLDLITNDNTATFRLLKRADADDPTVMGDPALFTLHGHQLPVAWRARPAGIPGDYGVAGDDRPVLLYQDVDQHLAIAVPESIGSTAIERTFRPTYTDGEEIRLSYWRGLSGRTMFAIADWDEDGRWDVVFNSQYNNANIFYRKPDEYRNFAYIRSRSPFWLRNVGTNAEPEFERARRIRHADGGIIRVETHAANVYPADLNGDGHLDLFFSDGPSMLYYFMRDELSWDKEPSP